MGIQEFPSKPVNKGGVVVGTINGPTEVAIGAQDSYFVADSTATPGAKWQTYRQFYAQQLTSGTSWTVPATVTTIDVIVIGGGAGGEGRSTDGTTSNTSVTGNGGGGGAVVYQKNYPVTPGASIAYSIGSGGSGGASPEPTASTTNLGAAGGNTTFGSIVAPGAQSRIGSNFGWATTSTTRGVYDVIASTVNNNSQTYNSNTWAELAGFPLNPDASGFFGIATSVSAQSNTSIPRSDFTAATISANNLHPHGLSTTFSKITSLLTAPVGSTATNELTANTKFDGWAGYGGNGRSGTTGTLTNPTWHGGGQGGSVNTSTTGTFRRNAGANAATNSGAGGGGCAVFAGSGPSVAGAAGGAGGSGIILIGYWA
jgi:hypothetical protein